MARLPIFNFKLPPEMLDALKDEAARRRETYSEFARRAIERALVDSGVDPTW